MLSIFRLFAYLRKYAFNMFLAFIVLSISTVGILLQPKVSQWVIDNGISAGILKNIIIGSIGMFMFGIIGSLLNISGGYLLIKSSQGMGHDIRKKLFKKIVSFSFINFDKWRTGELLVRLNSDIYPIQMFVRMNILMILNSLLMIIGSSIFMFITNTRLASIIVMIMGGILIISISFATFMHPLFMKIRTKVDELNNTIQENLAGAKIVRVFNRQQSEKEKFGSDNIDLYRILTKVGYSFSIVMPFFIFSMNVCITLILWLGGSEIIQQYNSISGFTLGQLVAFDNYAMMTLFPIIMIGDQLRSISMANASADRIITLLEELPGIKKPDKPVAIKKIKGRIELEGIHFGYGGAEEVLNNINLTITPGEKIGIIGGTGSGKSSLAYLIPRFYDPQNGMISIDGVDIRKYDPMELRKHIGIVLQDIILFSGGIKKNILYGNPEGGEEIAEWAARISQATPFLDEKGWENSLGEWGVGLSGGQRQRVAIARAIASKPAILILDDATSSLDLETEEKLTSSIYNELGDSTVLIISQKIQTIKKSDRIIVMHEGKINGIGTHDELIAKNNIYQDIEKTQNTFTQ